MRWNRISALLLLLVAVITGAYVSQIPFVVGQSSSSSVSQVTVQVTYSGSWQGAYQSTGASSSTASWSGTGNKSVNISRPSGVGIWIISANAEKLDDSSAILVIRMLAPDGTTLQEGSTDAPYGVAQIGYSVEATTTSGIVIPEFPTQLGITLLVTTVVVASYVLARRVTPPA